MGKRKKSGKKLVRDLQSSFAQADDGQMTAHFASVLLEPLNSAPVDCTITRYCRTFLYDFPSAYLVSEKIVEHKIIYSHEGLKVVLVSDLPAYFKQGYSPSQHYAIDVSLRAGVHSVYENAIKKSRKKANLHAPLFLVIEQNASVPPTKLNSGQCFTVDECLNGVAMIKGGREGERTLFAIQTSDAPWPDIQADMHAVNMVLTAVKVEQNHTGHLEKLHQSSCFASSEGHAVYHFPTPRMSANLSALSRVEPSDLSEKGARIGSMLQEVVSESEPVLAELFDSIVMDKTKDDNYLRLWYLRLWQALEDTGSILGKPQPFNDNNIIAGTRSPKELLDYRNKIAHWHTGKIDHSYLSDLQLTAMELLRRRFALPRNLHTTS